MSVKTENTIEASKASYTKEPSETITGASSDPIEERIRANLEPVNAQISILTQLSNQLIQGNLAKTTPTAGPGSH